MPLTFGPYNRVRVAISSQPHGVRISDAPRASPSETSDLSLNFGSYPLILTEGTRSKSILPVSCDTKSYTSDRVEVEGKTFSNLGESGIIIYFF